MKKLHFVLPLLLVCFNAFSQKLPEIIFKDEFSIGKTFQINSAVLDEKRIINIYLPLEYEEQCWKRR